MVQFHWVRLKIDARHPWTLAEKVGPDFWYVIGDAERYRDDDFAEIGPLTTPPANARRGRSPAKRPRAHTT